MSKAKKKKIPKIEPGEDGLVLVEVIKPRLGRKAGATYRVDPQRARQLLELGLAALAKEADHG